NLSYDQATHAATFNASQPLLSFVTYTATVSGVKDLSGNTLAAPYTWSFTTRGIWLQTSVADFNTGTNDGTVVTNNSGGEVTLAPLLQEDFSGTALNNANGTTTDVSLGALPTGFHTYKVQPTSSGFQFYVDGVLQTTIAASFQTTVSLKAGLSDFTGTSGQPLQADSVSFKSYSTTRS